MPQEGKLKIGAILGFSEAIAKKLKKF